MANILVIDDDEDLLRIVRRTLETSGHDVTTHLSVPQIEVEEYLKYHLVLLDVMLPGENGFDYCARIRSRVNCPILFMSARNSEHDLSKGLLLGGDEYIKKPFSIIELRARVEAHLRRENRILQTKQKFGNIELTIQSKELYVGEKLVKLSEEQRLYNEVSLRNIERMEKYLEKMRIIYDSYSLLESVEMRQQNFDVFIDSLRLDFETLAKSQQKELIFETKVCGNYLFSESLFRTALSNIMMNGLEHGGVKIFVRVYRNQDIHIVVEDSGDGFLDEVLVNGPVEFATANKARTMEPQNLHLGLGLYQAKVIIEKHGGKLSLSKSEKLGGAKVEIIL